MVRICKSQGWNQLSAKLKVEPYDQITNNFCHPLKVVYLTVLMKSFDLICWPRIPNWHKFLMLCETCTQASWHKTNITLLPNGLAMPNNPSTVNRTHTLLIQCHFQHFAFETDELISGQLICFKIFGSSHSSVRKAEMLDGFYK